MDYGATYGQGGSMSGQPAGGGMDWYTPSTGYNYGTGGLTAGSISSAAYQGNMGGGAGSFEEEPPLLEELGIDLSGILKKTRLVFLHRLNNRFVDDLDMGGALVFVFVLGGLHLLMGKLHFGIILGWSVVHSAILWFVINQLAGAEATEARGLDLYHVCCVIGYCMVPLVVYSAVSLLIPRGMLSFSLAALCTLWSSETASRIVVRRTPALEGMQRLIMLPCLLCYSAFMMLCVY
uniref:Protein YIP n=1 Tax=Chlamydomonas euryale TaxID=1486919 RepID=A0A7R9VFU1_9CHLO|mmetsp:Transcript_33100/g.98449  ORF Transcript_33100/g.98449 Transcript_33100/m.98449 type:complete len:235 (+) Transcript_33100:68-772(+)